ncbi:hypothetical protein EG834_14915, partial [bacterium]|nr:hypothetical protein [bacterium]
MIKPIERKEEAMHRKLALMWITAALLLTLPACSAAATTSGAGTQSAAAATGEVSLAVKLAAGTLKLEGSAQAVTPEQARALLPLWKAARN